MSMKNKFLSGKISLTILITSLVVGVFFLGKTLTNVSATEPTPVCTSTEPQCGTDNGTQEVTEYTEYVGICPTGYHYQNEGNWNQRCHRDENCSGGGCPPQHRQPTGVSCPDGYTQNPYWSWPYFTCSRVVNQDCHTGVIQYDSCPLAGECPDYCNYQGGDVVADGHGGTLTCQATDPCPLQCRDDQVEVENECVCPEGQLDLEGQCVTPEEPVYGCTDPKATNYDPKASDDDGSCVLPTPNPDVCPNLEGIQYSIPDSYHLDAAGVNCVQYELGGAPAPSESTGGEAVLGASTVPSGQVLGASSMAATGVAMDNVFALVFSLGSVLSAFGIRKFSKLG